MKINVVFPVSVLAVEPTLELKTLKIGLITRYLAIYRVDTATVYIDRAVDARDIELLKTIVQYMVTAPYLRRQIFPKANPYLRYAGLLPPLQLETHGVGGPKVGEVRQALVLSRRGSRIVVDAGLGETVEISTPGSLQLRRGQIVHVKIKTLKPRPQLELLDPVPREIYTGFAVEVRDSLGAAIKVLRSRNCRLIATSRKGTAIHEVYNDLSKLIAESSCLAILFGAPDKGLYEIAEDEGLDLEKEVDMVVNTIPSQGVLRVRTEEAIAATLSIVNFMLHAIGKTDLRSSGKG